MFKINLGRKELLDYNMKITKRTAVRGVIFSEGKILMVRTNKGDYKFPGGGMKKGESVNDTLIREVLEETGYKVTKISYVLGEALYKNIDDKDKDKLFVMKSIYIKCFIDKDSKTHLKLDDYEKEMEFTPVFIDLKEVLKRQENVFKENKSDMNDWVERELKVLQILNNITALESKYE